MQTFSFTRSIEVLVEDNVRDNVEFGCTHPVILVKVFVVVAFEPASSTTATSALSDLHQFLKFFFANLTTTALPIILDFYFMTRVII